MDGQIDTGVLISAIMYFVPLIALVISIVTFTNAVKERHGKSAAEQAGISIKLDTLSKTIDDIKKSIDDLRSGQHKHESAITKLETKVTGLEGRVKRVETNLKDLEQRVHSFHSN